jgi:uncharacterized protein (TIGR02301 family)
MHPAAHSRYRYWRNALTGAALGVVVCSTAALAQQVVKVPPPVERTPAPLLAPIYEPQMMRLAEVLGALHYLRELCATGEGGLWRKQMEELIRVEEPTEARKARLIAQFNRGFRGLREVYRNCTPAAGEAANLYLRQGMKLAGEIPARFGR